MYFNISLRFLLFFMLWTHSVGVENIYKQNHIRNRESNFNHSARTRHGESGKPIRFGLENEHIIYLILAIFTTDIAAFIDFIIWAVKSKLYDLRKKQSEDGESYSLDVPENWDLDLLTVPNTQAPVPLPPFHSEDWQSNNILLPGIKNVGAQNILNSLERKQSYGMRKTRLAPDENLYFDPENLNAELLYVGDNLDLDLMHVHENVDTENLEMPANC